MADPSFRGFIETTLDALLIFEGVRRGLLCKIERRLQDVEKRALVTSGAVFVFDEDETGIKRWTDGLNWSPSRTLGNFLVYRELDKRAEGAGRGKDAEASGSGAWPAGGEGSMSAAAHSSFEQRPFDPPQSTFEHRSTSQPAGAYTAETTRRRSLSDGSLERKPAGMLDRARERQLVGSLTSTYRFRSDGLVKKTISLSGLHLVAYYKIEDVTEGRLRSPTSHLELRSLEIASFLLEPGLYRLPPLVDVAPDGTMTYKGEADTGTGAMIIASALPITMSPGGGSTIRQRPISPPVARAPPVVPSPVQYSSPSFRSPVEAPPSPHRPLPSVLRQHRFEPYSNRPVTSNSPPTAHNSGGYSNSFAYPSIPQSTMGAQGYHSPPGRSEATGISPRMDSVSMMSSSAPTGHGWGQARSTQQSVGLSRQVMSDQASDASEYYQPRHPTAFVPPHEGGHSNGGDLYSSYGGQRSTIPSVESNSPHSESTAYSHYGHSDPVQALPPLQSYRPIAAPSLLPSLSGIDNTPSVPVQYHHIPPSTRYRNPQSFDHLSYPTYPTSNSLAPLQYAYSVPHSSAPRTTSVSEGGDGRGEVAPSTRRFETYSTEGEGVVKDGGIPASAEGDDVTGSAWWGHSWQPTALSKGDGGGYP